MVNIQLFQTMKGALLPDANVRNQEHAPAYALSARHQLAQLAATGCLNQTFYANAQAMEGYRTGAFPDGSIIVDEGVYADDAKGVMVERGSRSLDVMHKNSATHAATGGWGFEHFDGDSQVGSGTAEARAACATCHGQRKAQDYVFSTFRR